MLCIHDVDITYMVGMFLQKWSQSDLIDGIKETIFRRFNLNLNIYNSIFFKDELISLLDREVQKMNLGF